jgi:hypothetical protein
MTVFRELALDFNPSILVGVSASNLSRQPFTAKFDKFTLQGPAGQEVAVRPVSMTRLVSTGLDRRGDGSLVLEGAALKVLKSTGASPEAQSMSQYKGKWSEDRQLLWRPLSQGEAITLEVPVDSTGKFEIKARFTMSPDSGIINLAMDSRSLYQGRPLDFYYKETRPAKLMSLGTVSLDKGRHRLTITVQDRNPKSRGYSVGLDELQVVPVKQ